jgi:type I restriction enzyme M protein
MQDFRDYTVAAVNPQLGETVLDPACGTGGFLVGAFEHLKKQCNTAEDYRRLQRESLYGVEAKPLPYLLCQMNLLLHGMETPTIDPLNALRFPLREIGNKDRMDVIITNPPFGGAEERGILGNFPEDKQTSETTLLFLQLIMRKLKRIPKPGRRRDRAQRRSLWGWRGSTDKRGAIEGVQFTYNSTIAQRRICALHKHTH